MARQEAEVVWTLSPQGHVTTRSTGWLYTVYPCRDRWVWTREPVYHQLSPEVEVVEASSCASCASCASGRRAVEESIARGRRRR